MAVAVNENVHDAPVLLKLVIVTVPFVPARSGLAVHIAAACAPAPPSPARK
jgi:hypothetical protein